MTSREKLLLDALICHVGHQGRTNVIKQLWHEGLIYTLAVEKLFIPQAVAQLMALGMSKTRACDEVAQLLGCSFEKVRGILYEHNNKQDEHKNQNNKNENKD